MSQSTEKIDYGLVIATYKREKILPRCLRLAAQQTVPPKEIIVVDASPDWEKTRAKIMQELATKYSAIDWKYVQAKRPSSTAQRNQGIDLATADILFLIDDDSLMYPNCAEEVMRIYAHDTAHQVKGIMCFLELKPPSEQAQGGVQQLVKSVSNKQPVIISKLRRFLNLLLKDKTVFIHYDPSFTKYTLPESLKNMAVHRIYFMPGARMTYRREVFKQIRFEETLDRYAACEDMDVGCRVSRIGILLHAQNARLCHLQASGGRLSRFAVRTLWGLNQTVLHRLYSSDIARSKKLLFKLFWQKIFALTIKDVLAFHWSLPSTRSLLFIFWHYKNIFSRTPEELRIWYPKFQQEIIKRR